MRSIEGDSLTSKSTAVEPNSPDDYALLRKPTGEASIESFDKNSLNKNAKCACASRRL